MRVFELFSRVSGRAAEGDGVMERGGGGQGRSPHDLGPTQHQHYSRQLSKYDVVDAVDLT